MNGCRCNYKFGVFFAFVVVADADDDNAVMFEFSVNDLQLPNTTKQTKQN